MPRESFWGNLPAGLGRRGYADGKSRQGPEQCSASELDCSRVGTSSTYLAEVRAPVRQECRDAQDAKRDIPVPLSPSLVTTGFCAPAALRPPRASALRAYTHGSHNGLTAGRTRLHMPSAGYRTSFLRHSGHTPAPYAYRRLRAFASLSMARSGRATSCSSTTCSFDPFSRSSSWSTARGKSFTST